LLFKTMIMHRLDWFLGPAERASKPGHDLLPLDPLAPGRILGAADVLEPRPNRLLCRSWRLASIAVEPKPRGKGDPPAPRVQEAEAFRR
jgi:hypothetical protein